MTSVLKLQSTDYSGQSTEESETERWSVENNSVSLPQSLCLLVKI